MKFPHLRALVCCLVIAWTLASGSAAEGLLRAGDVVTLLGGEEMVSAAELGELELAMTVAAPQLRLRFRSFAWEGDTVYAQRRDLNYPGLPQQLAMTGATVIVAQFGQMESLDGVGELPRFIQAYEGFLDSVSGGATRRIALLLPHPFTPPVEEGRLDLSARNGDVEAYAESIRAMANRRNWRTADWSFASASAVTEWTRDGVHLNEWGERLRALSLVGQLMPEAGGSLAPGARSPALANLLQLIQQKNQLWFNYYRPQNWAFLAGDRINQPSSRDHLKPDHRWFPAEMQEYPALVEAKDRAIWEAAAALAKP